MNNVYWIRKTTKTINGITVHEVKCPFCHNCETYTKDPPKTCYICDAKLKIKD